MSNMRSITVGFVTGELPSNEAHAFIRWAIENPDQALAPDALQRWQAYKAGLAKPTLMPSDPDKTPRRRNLWAELDDANWALVKHRAKKAGMPLEKYVGLRLMM